MSTLSKIINLCPDFSNNLHFAVIVKTLSGELFVFISSPAFDITLELIK